MARAVKIFGDATQGSLFFEGVTIPPAPLGGIVLASAHPNAENRIRVVRNDQFQKNGVDPRILFKRMINTRVRNKAGQRLVQDLGYTQQQVIDYINDEANRKANEVDFHKNGSLVGSGNTINFTGGIENVTVSNDVATIAINQVGITTSGGYVGTGITLFDFRGSGVSTVTPVTSGITTVFFEGGSGSAGNPVTSGILTSGNSTLRLTLNDASTVDVDVSALNNVSPVSLAASTSYFYLNNGVQLANNQHDKNNGVVFYGTPVRRGEELVFGLPSDNLHIGIWDGGNGVTGVTNVNNKSNWSTKWAYDVSNARWSDHNVARGQTGTDLSVDVGTNAGTFAIRFDHQTEKLQLWEVDTAYSWKLSNANVALGVTETYIYFSTESDTQATPPGSLPGISTLRAQDFTLKSYTDADRPGDSLYGGTKVNDVWKSNKSLRPGMKIKFTVPTSAGNQYWATNFEGTEDLGSGENNAYQAGEMTWRLTNQEKFFAHTDATMNTNYTAIDSSTITLALPGRNMSWRYNTNNTWDIFDEDTDEVVLTGDDTLDGGDMYPYLLSVNNSDDVLSDYVQFEW